MGSRKKSILITSFFRFENKNYYIGGKVEEDHSNADSVEIHYNGQISQGPSLPTEVGHQRSTGGFGFLYLLKICYVRQYQYELELPFPDGGCDPVSIQQFASYFPQQEDLQAGK